MIKSLIVHNFILFRNRLSFLDVKKLFLEKNNKKHISMLYEEMDRTYT